MNFFCHYNISKNEIYYKDVDHAEYDYNYITLRDTLHDYMYTRK